MVFLGCYKWAVTRSWAVSPCDTLVKIYGKNCNNRTVCYVVGLAHSGKVRCFFPFGSLSEGWAVLFCSGFLPFSKVGILSYITRCPIITVFTVTPSWIMIRCTLTVVMIWTPKLIYSCQSYLHTGTPNMGFRICTTLYRTLV